MPNKYRFTRPGSKPSIEGYSSFARSIIDRNFKKNTQSVMVNGLKNIDQNCLKISKQGNDLSQRNIVSTSSTLNGEPSIKKPKRPQPLNNRRPKGSNVSDIKERVQILRYQPDYEPSYKRVNIVRSPHVTRDRITLSVPEKFVEIVFFSLLSKLVKSASDKASVCHIPIAHRGAYEHMENIELGSIKFDGNRYLAQVGPYYAEEFEQHLYEALLKIHKHASSRKIKDLFYIWDSKLESFSPDQIKSIFLDEALAEENAPRLHVYETTSGTRGRSQTGDIMMDPTTERYTQRLEFLERED